METGRKDVLPKDQIPPAISVGTPVNKAEKPDFARSQPGRVGRPLIKVLEIKSANKEYPYQLPKGCKRFKIQCRDGTALRIATEKDVVATPSSEQYWTMKAGVASGENSPIWSEDNLDIQDDSVILYFACASGDKFVEILIWL